jgi:recombinational DNA repair ATPase RecF
MMQLNSLNTRRFRGVLEGAVTGLTDVNVLIGRNNSGKTTIAEAITRLAYHITNADLDSLKRSVNDIWNSPRNEQGG